MVSQGSGSRKWWLLGVVLLLLIAAGLGWMERTRLVAWYYVHRLVQADGAGRDKWFERIAGYEESAVADMLGRLKQADASECDNILWALTHLADRLRTSDASAVLFAGQLVDSFPAANTNGKRCILEVAAALLKPPSSGGQVSASLVAFIGRLPRATAQTDDSVLHAHAIALANQLLSVDSVDGMTAESCRELTTACFTDPDPQNRTAALELAAHSKINLLDKTVPLLRDPEAEVRRAAILAIGPAPDLIATDDLLYWLHDSDLQVRKLCETALRGRGLREEQLQLGRLITDNQAKVRMQVLPYLRPTTNLEPTPWLRRLTHDPVSAVRAAAIRAAAERAFDDLKDRVEQMANTDPSPTVRQVARYYLSCRN
jgi:HEAT repeat protein